MTWRKVSDEAPPKDGRWVVSHGVSLPPLLGVHTWIRVDHVARIPLPTPQAPGDRGEVSGDPS